MTPTEFSDFYRNRLLEITRFIARRVDSAFVEDLASDLFEVAWRKRDEIPVGFELPWLYKTARFLISNHRRKLSGRAQAMVLFGEPDAAPSAEAIALADLSLAEAWRNLSSSHREILALSAWDGLSPSELAKALGISVNAANVRLSRARAQLADQLAKQDGQED